LLKSGFAGVNIIRITAVDGTGYVATCIALLGLPSTSLEIASLNNSL
jgi:hypothetical protein